MRGLVIYHSGFGNTKLVAEALARGMQEGGIETDCMEIQNVVLNDLSRYDFLAIGSPTHMLGPSKEMKAFLEDLRTIDLKGKNTFCFETRNESRMNNRSYFALENSAARRIEAAAKRMKMHILRPRESALVKGREGPLYLNVEEQFEMIGREISNLLTASSMRTKRNSVSV